MDFAFTAEQRLYRDTIRSFVDKQIIPVARDAERSGRYPAEIVEAMRGLGLFGLLVPEAYGGMGADSVSFAVTFEEISRGWMGIAGILGSHSLSCWMIARHGTEPQKRRYLPDLATGARRTGIALTEPGAGTDLQGIATTARRDGEHYVVNGTKTWITNARHADPLPVLVKTDPAASPAHRGMSILLIDAGTPGFEVTRDIPKLGYKGPESCEVVLTDVRVPRDQLLGGTEGRGMQQALSALETGRINVAARAVGLAEMATRVQAARLLTYWAAARLDAGQRADAESGMAKVFASETALYCSLESMRVHGGYGYSEEFEVARLYRDAPLMAIGEGTNDVLRTVIARALVSGNAAVG